MFWVSVALVQTEGFPPLPPSIFHIAMWMLQRGTHLPHHSWATSAYGDSRAANTSPCGSLCTPPRNSLKNMPTPHIFSFSGQERDGIATMGWGHLDNRLGAVSYEGVKAYAGRVHIMCVGEKRPIVSAQRRTRALHGRGRERRRRRRDPNPCSLRIDPRLGCRIGP